MNVLCLRLALVGLLFGGESAAHAQAPSGHSAAAPMQVWNRTSQGMSTNAALAFYRVQNVGRPAMPPTAFPQYSRVPTVVTYPASPYTAHSYYPSTASSQMQKPFSYVRPPATAYHRYWPYLMEGYENPETGYIIWTMP
jgi:hypothetical protein